MIELTVKTLDSQNHSFTVDDDITVAQFKEKIADTVNIPADTQRIIYCGRVLQDESKLKEYDVHGKVVHLVQRAPPASNQRSRPATPPPHRRHFRGPEHGNAMYFGSMAIPSSLLDPQNVVLPLSPHSLSASRLNVARRMLRRAALVLNALENPQNPEQPSQEEQQEDVTPVFEARVLVPTDPMDDVLSAVHNNLINAGAVQLGSSSQPVFLQEGLANQQEVTVERNNLGVDDSGSPRARSISSTPGGVSPLANSIENLSALNNQEATIAMDTVEASDSTGVQGTEAPQSGVDRSSGTSTNITENVSRTSEFAELLENMARFQTRFAPYMDRYIQFMRNDPAISEENTRQTQAFINRVSEVLHFLGHAYHSLSDIIVRVRTPPPRPLLCRPVVIQHPTVVQAGIPIQVEAQINISPDSTNPSRSQTSQVSNSATSTNQQETNTVNRNIPSSSTTSSGGNEPVASSAVLQPTVVGFPMFPGPTSMRVQTIPVEIRSLSSPRISLTLPRSNNNNNNIPNMSTVHTPASNETSSNNLVPEQTTSSTETPVSGGGPSSTTASSTTSSVPGGLQGATFTIPGFHNNPNMEVFMEVTPESITIDSMETTFVGGGQANELLQNAFQGPPSDILNSIWHMAGQLVNRGAQSTQSNTPNPTSSSTSTTAPSAPPTEQIDSSTSESFGTQTTSNLGLSAATTQNSQARGNTQTNPTTATHTRSTSRPHVHLAQHAIQGFDPYLPCNSHHVVPWRRFQSSNARQDNATATASGQNLQSGGTGTDRDSGSTRIYPVNNTIMNILQGIVNSIHTIYGRQAQQQPQAQQQQRTTVNVAQATPLDNGVTGSVAQSAGDGVGQGATTDLNSLPLQLLQTFMPQLQNINLSDSNTSGPTIAELLQLSSVSEGENLFLDLINLLSRHLTVGDLIQSTNGRLEPWMRIRSSIRNFFLVRVMNGSCSSVAIDRGVNRILSEMQPLFNHLNALPTRDDIDLVRSAQSLFRARLPNIISLATSRSPNSLRMLVDQCLITAKQFGALILRASRNGQPGVEVVLDSIVSHHTRGIPREIQQWTLMTTRTQMRQFLSNLGVPDSVLQPYIVRKIDAVTSNVVAIAQKDQQGEAMQVDDVDRDDNSGGASGSTEITPSSVINLGDKENDGEPLPTVVLGSETWHNDVPADWVPIIARDAQRQRRQNSQAPFSDAYLSGMPSKRRKIVTAAKPRGSLSQVISESVRRAVTATGLASVAPLEVVAQGAGSDINIQSAYRELLRSNVRAGIRDNSDFTPERFPNATSYFNGPQ